MAPREVDRRRGKAPSAQETGTPTKKARIEKPVETKAQKAEAVSKQKKAKVPKVAVKKRKAPAASDSNKSPPKKTRTEKPEEIASKKSTSPTKQLKKKPSETKKDSAGPSQAELTKKTTKSKESKRKSSVGESSSSRTKASEAKKKSDEELASKTIEGEVWTCGQGDVGQLGLGVDIMEKTFFSCVPGLSKVVDICAGGMHTVCLTSDGTVFTFGCDDEGALGRQATDETCFTPDKVELESRAVQISAGDSHSAALLSDGRVFAWGSFRDSHGTMGLIKPAESSKTPTLIKLDKSVSKIASGSDHLVLLTVTGQLFSLGCPEQGQLGRVPARSASRDCRSGMSAFLTPQLMPMKKSPCFIDVWASTFGTFAKDKSGEVYRWGLNNFHQLGLSSEDMQGPVFQPKGGLNSRQFVKIEGGEHHTLLLDSEGKVYCLGRKEYGRLGLGENSNDADDVTPIEALKDVKCVDIAAGSAVSFAVTEDGAIYGWGMGSNYQLCKGDDDADVWEPRRIMFKRLEGKQVILAAAGGQHSVMLVKSPPETEQTN